MRVALLFLGLSITQLINAYEHDHLCVGGHYYISDSDILVQLFFEANTHPSELTECTVVYPHDKRYTVYTDVFKIKERRNYYKVFLYLEHSDLDDTFYIVIIPKYL